MTELCCFLSLSIVIKQRMQLKDSIYRSVRECARTVYRKEGITAFYISLPTTLSMSIPFQSIQFSTYERCLSLLNPGGQYDPKSHVVAGAVAGIIASSVTVSTCGKPYIHFIKTFPVCLCSRHHWTSSRLYYRRGDHQRTFGYETAADSEKQHN